MPLLLDMEGRLVVHASAVRLDAGVCLILGQSGWGKSTLAARLHLRGALLLSDDTVIIQCEGRQPTAQGLYPSLRLHDQSLQEVYGERVPGDVVSIDGYKNRIDLSHSTSAEAHPIGTLVLLDDPTVNAPSKEIRLRRLTPAEACMRVVGNCFAFCRSDVARASDRLEQVAALARTVPAYALSYPRNYSRLDLVCDEVIRLGNDNPRPGG